LIFRNQSISTEPMKSTKMGGNGILEGCRTFPWTLPGRRAPSGSVVWLTFFGRSSSRPQVLQSPSRAYPHHPIGAWSNVACPSSSLHSCWSMARWLLGVLLTGKLGAIRGVDWKMQGKRMDLCARGWAMCTLTRPCMPALIQSPCWDLQ
jgi:hypothetical protein